MPVRVICATKQAARDPECIHCEGSMERKLTQNSPLRLILAKVCVCWQMPGRTAK